ncbi:MAG: hypothetical protein GX326_02305 [Clostridiaceae bacterium]|nr:hypothetical protein [Clostridiaceae bacterium]
MTNYNPHLYMVLFPNQALVLSQLEAGPFSLRYSFGSTSQYEGKMIFAEIDINYRHPYFPIDDALELLKPHKDGSPKATKYVSTYRVLEHVDLDAIQSVYLCNADGSIHRLEEGKFETDEQEFTDRTFNLFLEVAPVSMITLSSYNMEEYGNWMTEDSNFVHVPRICFMDMRFDLEQFMEKFKQNPFTPSPIVGIHPAKLRDAVLDLARRKNKYVKGLTLHNALSQQSYSSIKNGILFMDTENKKFFPMPDLGKIEKENYSFFRSM